MSKKQVNLILADDSEDIHVALNSLIKDINDKENAKYKLNLLDEFYDTDELIGYIFDERGCPNLLLLDIFFEGGERGTDALEKIRKYAPDLAIILLSSSKDSSMINEAHDKYDVDYLPKTDMTVDDLLIRINRNKEKIFKEK